MSETRGPRVYRPAATATWEYDHRWGTQIGDNTRLSVTRTDGGGMVTAYAMAVNYYDGEGEPGWATAHADRQTPAHTLGLLRWHTLTVENDIIRYFDEEGGL